MDIEDVAHSTPDKILTIQIDPATGVMPHHGRTLAAALKLEGGLAKEGAKLLSPALRGLRGQGHERCWRSTR